MKSNLRIAYCTSFVAAGLLFSGVAHARQIESDAAWQHKKECYLSQRVPAKILSDTMGELVEGPSEEWRGNAHKSGSRVVRVQKDPVYITKTTEIEPQHITLVPISCR